MSGRIDKYAALVAAAEEYQARVRELEALLAELQQLLPNDAQLLGKCRAALKTTAAQIDGEMQTIIEGKL